jgi:hypothetical protein
VACPQQVRGLFKGDPAGEFFDLVAANDEDAVLAIDLAEPRLDRDDSVEAAPDSAARARHSLSDGGSVF